MDWKRATSLGSLTVVTAVAVFTAAIIPRFNVKSPPLLDELICWILVLGVVGFPSAASSRFWKSHGISSTTPLARLYWIAASSITVTAISSSFFDTIWVTPVVAYAIFARRPTLPLTHIHAFLPGYIPYKWFVVASGLALFASLAPTVDVERLATAIPTALGLAGTYLSLIRISGKDDEYIDGWEELETQKFVRSLAPRAHYLIALSSLGITAMRPGLMPDWTSAALAGGLKAIHWISILWLTQETPWEIAPMMRAYVAASISSQHPNAPGILGLFQTSTRAFIAVLSLYQTVNFLPTNERGRALLAVFALWPAASLVQHIFLEAYEIIFSSNGA